MTLTINCCTVAWRTISCAYVFLLVQNVAVNGGDDDDDDDHDGLFDWSGVDDDDFDFDDDDLLPVRVDGISAGKMDSFFVKLNALRRKRLVDRRKFAASVETARGVRPRPALPDRNLLATAAGLSPPEWNRTLSVAADSQPSLSDRETSRKELNRWPWIDAEGSTSAVTEAENDGVGVGIRDMSKVGKGRETSGAGSTDSEPRKKPQGQRVAGYLDMGWYSARCLWTQYLKAVGERETQAVRGKIQRFAMFWSTAIVVSIAFLWCAFGCFHELLCTGVIEPPDTYAKDVNKYLTIVPPHVVVTNKGKMFRYRPTAEERFLWSKAKKLSKFKI